MSQAVNKSAISVLDEFCKYKKQPPAEYTFLTKNDGETDFVCTVKSFDETKTGKGKINKFILYVEFNDFEISVFSYIKEKGQTCSR